MRAPASRPRRLVVIAASFAATLVAAGAPAARAVTATTFHALTPARLEDTRSGPAFTTVDGLGAGGGSLGPGQTIELAVRGRGGVPLHGAGSVALNVTATEATTATFVTVFPGGVRPNASTVNVVPGQTVANSTIVRLSADGTVSIYNNLGDVHLVVDVLAWVPAGPAFTGVDPARLLDTRSGPGIATVDGQFLGGGARAGGSTLDLTVLGRGGVPAQGVGSVALNVTATEPTTDTYVTVHPTGTARPTASNLNVAAGRTAAALVIVPVGTSGAVSLFQFAGSAHLVVDVLGWFPASASFTGVTPARLADTRSGPGIATVDGQALGAGAVTGGSTFGVPVLGRGGVPATGVGSVVLNVTITEPSSPTYVTVFPAGATRPTASNLNAVAGQTVANTVIVPVGAGGAVSLFQFAGAAHLVVDVLGWFPPSIDLPVGVTSLVSATPAGAASMTNWSENGVVSADGRFVAFDSRATDLIPGDTNVKIDVFVRDRVTGSIERVSVTSAEVQVTGDSYIGSISADGRYVAFISVATDLVPGDTNAQQDVFVRDRQAGTTTRASVATGGAQALGGPSNQPDLTDDGRYVVFTSAATNLVAGDSNNQYDIFRRDLQTGTTIRVSVATGGGQSTGSGSYLPSISNDGRYVVFTSAAANLVAGDANATSDVFRRDITGGTTTRVSVSSSGGDGLGASGTPRISADGRFVAFESLAPNLVAGDTNGHQDVFVRDLTAGATTRVSVNSDGVQSADGSFARPAGISADGRFVAFSSTASDLVDDDTNGQGDGFVRDRTRGITYRISVTTDGLQVTGASSGATSISADGTVVGFESEATGFGPVDGNGVLDVYARVFAAV